MKNLYRRGTVHPSPPFSTDHLSFLPAAILTLAVALSAEDKEVLSYLISCSSDNNFSGNSHRNTKKNKSTATVGGHAPLFHCSCFHCYLSYWERWDSSPNRQLIHEIIDEFEDWLAQNSSNNNNGREKRNSNKKKRRLNKKKQNELMGSVSDVSTELESVQNSSNNSEDGDKVEEEEKEKEKEKGTVRKIVTFIGQSIWGAWGR